MFLAHSMVLHFVTPAASRLKPLLRAYEVGMQSGDTENAMWSMLHYVLLGWISGKPLELLDRDFRLYTAQMKGLNRELAYFCSTCVWQAIQNLMGKAPDPAILTGEVLDEEVAEKAATIDKFKVPVFEAFRFIARFYAGDIESCASYALEKGNIVKEGIPGSPTIFLDAYFRALSLTTMAKRTKSRKFKRAAKEPIKQIKTWVEQGNPNVLHYESLLDAEMAALNGRNHQARKHYEVAVILAARGGFQQDAALANER